MMALLWKDYRLNRMLLVFGAIVLFGPYLAGVLNNVYSELRLGNANWSLPYWTIVSFASLILSLFTIAMLGANAIAAERANRSAEFLAYLPPTRRANIISKGVIVLGAFVVIWLVNLSIVYIIIGRFVEGLSLAEIHQSYENVAEGFRAFAATSVVILGVSWFGSSVSPSHGLATGMGLAAPIPVGFPLGMVEEVYHPPGFDFVWWYTLVCVTLGLIGFVAGTVYYLRRVEP